MSRRVKAFANMIVIVHPMQLDEDTRGKIILRLIVIGQHIKDTLALQAKSRGFGKLVAKSTKIGVLQTPLIDSAGNLLESGASRVASNFFGAAYRSYAINVTTSTYSLAASGRSLATNIGGIIAEKNLLARWGYIIGAVLDSARLIMATGSLLKGTNGIAPYPGLCFGYKELFVRLADILSKQAAKKANSCSLTPEQSQELFKAALEAYIKINCL